MNVSYATMSQINFDPAAKQLVGSLVNQAFINKLENIKKYLSNIINQDNNYHLLIQNLDSLIAEAISYQIRVTIVGRKEELVEKVKLVKQTYHQLNSVSEFTTITFPCNINSLLKNCDLVFLVINSTKNSIPIEKNLVNKAQAANIPLIIRDFNQSPNQIQSWLKYPDVPTINYFKFPLESTQQYHDFLERLIAQLMIKIEANLKEKLSKIIRKHFFQNKSQYWSEIAQHKQQYFLGNTHQETRAKVQQSFQQFNHILLHHLRIIKQTIQESKQELINPFVSTSAIYHIHQVVHEAIAVEYRDNKKIYLNLVITKDQYRQAIHSHVLELYQQQIDLWIDQKWNFLDQELKVFTQFREKSDRELKILNKLSGTEVKMPVIPKPKFDLNKYICVSTVSKINRIVFDYHYTQSTWFRLMIAISIGLLFFLFTDRLFGFFFLIVQIINLLTGQSSKYLKLKQQTKELKRVVDNKYQNLVKFIADKLIQDINLFLEQQSQYYQKQVATYVKETHRNLAKIQEKIIFNQNKISELNKVQQDIMNIIDNR